MVLRESPHLLEFRKTLTSWTDERFISRDQLEALAMFNLYLVNLGDQQGWSYDGHSFKCKAPLSVLVVKATLDGTPVVSFITGRTFANCAKIFLRHVESDTVEWRKDRYRG